MNEDDVIILCACLTAVVLNVIFYGYWFVRIIMPLINYIWKLFFSISACG